VIFISSGHNLQTIPEISRPEQHPNGLGSIMASSLILSFVTLILFLRRQTHKSSNARLPIHFLCQIERDTILSDWQFSSHLVCKGNLSGVAYSSKSYSLRILNSWENVISQGAVFIRKHTIFRKWKKHYGSSKTSRMD